jgi:iron complex transport system ATP-binding protein
MSAGRDLLVESLRVERAGRTLLALDRLAIRAGEFVAIVGPNGAGKSTLIRALTGEWPARGRIELFGRALSDWDRRALATRLAVMTQASVLGFDFTVAEVVALGRLPHRGESRASAGEAVASALEALELGPFAQRSYLALSGGERQRVQFARVLAQLHGIEGERALLLDEPTSALDLRQQRSVLDLAWRAARSGACVVAVLHDLNLAARYADRICVIESGRLLADASPSHCLTEAMVARAFGLPVSIEPSRIDGLPVVLPRAPGAS